MSQITQEWLVDLGGIQGCASAGGLFWDFPIFLKQATFVETFLRVHEPINDDGWATDLFDQNGLSIGIVNWPTTKQQLFKLLVALGCETNQFCGLGARDQSSVQAR